MEKTTIQLNSDTLERLKLLKSFDRQSYDDLISNMLDNVHEESLSTEEIEEIQIGLEDVKKGRVNSIEQVAKKLGVVLR